ncbi:hypothetical protein [Fluviicola sp.]|uniref:hypothetical protein n=1 Tax=Fluviicola sp. TaxID=1917219 RepID=UPI003D289C5A
MFVTITEFKSRLKIRARFVELLKVHLVIKPLQIVFKKYSNKQLKVLESKDRGTVGKDLSQILKENQLTIIPRFEDHDLKHLILGYGMTSMEEIRMQAYLFGNGNWSPFCLVFLATGLIFPEEWKSFYAEFKKGRTGPNILHLRVVDCMDESTEEMIRRYRRV